MTREQLDLLIEYINIKCAIASRGYSTNSEVDRLVEILRDLETTTMLL